MSGIYQIDSASGSGSATLKWSLRLKLSAQLITSQHALHPGQYDLLLLRPAAAMQSGSESFKFAAAGEGAVAQPGSGTVAATGSQVGKAPVNWSMT
jgi:hypothetical protein